MPFSLQKSSAPLPTSITCCEWRITAMAADIGFFIMVNAPTAPAFPVAPSMIDASNSFLPSWVKTDPLPALNKGESSMLRMAASTASTAEWPFFNIVSPSNKAVLIAFVYSISNSGVIFFLVIVPAPPCITKAYCGLALWFKTNLSGL